MRRMLNQAANAAVKAKGQHFPRTCIAGWYPGLDTRKPSGPAHKLCRVVWKILHDGLEYQERGKRPIRRLLAEGGQNWSVTSGAMRVSADVLPAA